ncbi:mannose-1-phosphate guanylyltransferase/mannose-6-phosphate isomerase [Salicola sp. Rm-C-2C1-2]|uniref:mannose-1-phosphate guanylyltransferase/mannose-6-phosphate isomerase n=1 Tax=Salicola sp. Rm-C-2C1-2 TaxID=3141321 RepID=UPI0032E3956B
MFVPVVMAGGTGSRLWPLSRQLNPKQFHKVTDDRASMLQSTLARLCGLHGSEPSVICNNEHRFLVAEQLREQDIHDPRIILEPVGRNTAPAIALVALDMASRNDDSVMLVLPADHSIQDTKAFQSCVKTALPHAESGKLVTFGIKPDRPETGYGYIQAGPSIDEGVNAVRRFVEKPDIETAQTYLDSGEHTWNSGMFMFRPSAYLDELQTNRPDILEVCKRAMGASDQDMHFLRVNEEPFSACPEDSIDYAVMEHTESAVVVEMDVGWSDIGSWGSLWDHSQKDGHGNVLTGDVLTQDTHNSLVRAESRLVATVGIDDLVVVETKDSVLVAHKDSVQDVKKVVERIKTDGRQEHLNDREVYRPWGMYDSVDQGVRYQVKRITVNPGSRLSLQMHHHRAEHWVVVSGTAKVTNGDESYLVTENQSTYIPVGRVHTLENPGVIPLELIEVQSGSYLGEDDIVRLKDQYGRT